MHKNHYEYRFIGVHRSLQPSLCPIFSQNCLHILSKGIQKYSETAAVYSRSEINQMSILKNSKELLEHLKPYN